MEKAQIDGITLEYEVVGKGEPVVCIHGALIADAFRPLLMEPALAGGFQLITYHRRGYGGSRWAGGPVAFAEQAADCRGVLRHIGVERAHVVGHSYGAAVALQLALDAPRTVQSIALLEAGLMIGASAQSYREMLSRGRQRYLKLGPQVAVDEFLHARWPDYREDLQRVLPGAFQQATADAGAWYEADLQGSSDWHFGEDEARRITQPALVVLGEMSVGLHPRFEETYRALLEWLPDAEGFIVPEAAHFVQLQNPRPLAEALAGFLTRHPMSC